MAEIIREDVTQQGLDRLPFEPWHDKPVVTGLLTSLLTPLQEVEDLLHQLNNERSIDTAIGVQLDMFGALFNEPRSGRFDEEYRSAIKGRIAGQISSGTSPDIKSTAKSTTGASKCLVFEHFPGAAYVFTNKPVSYSSANAIETSAMCGIRTRSSWYNGDDYFVPTHSRGVYSNNLTDENGNIYLVDTPSGEFELLVDLDGYTVSTVPTLLMISPLNNLGIDIDDGNGVQDLAIGVLHRAFSDSTSGFTSLVPGATTYEVVDGRGKLVAPSSLPVDTLQTGYILDQDGSFIVDNYGNNIRYVTYS